MMNSYVYFDPETGTVTGIMNNTELQPETGSTVLFLDGPWIEDRPEDWRVIDGELVLVSLEGIKRKRLAEISEWIGSKRREYITDIPGQEMIYQAKVEEAKAYVQMDAEPESLEEFPFLAQEVGVTAPSAWGLAQLWLFMSSHWRSVASELERLRLTASRDVQEAGSSEEIELILSGLKAALEEL
jgi:hypothetical protein